MMTNNNAIVRIPEKLAPLCGNFFTGKYRYRGAYGGRGSAKTRTFAILLSSAALILDAAHKTGQILVIRQFKNSLDSSSFVEIKEAIYSQGWEDYFDIGDRYIRTKSRRILFNFVGLDRNVDSIKSNGHVWLAWADEAETISEEAWNKLKPTVRNEEQGDGESEGWFSEIWVTWNPERPDSPVDKLFRKNILPDSLIININWYDNPFFPEVLNKERKNDKIRSPSLYKWIWEGDYLFDGKNVIIRGEWFDACIGAHEMLGIDPRGDVVIGFDVADGDEHNSASHDACAMVVMNGSLLEYGELWQAGENELIQSVERVANFAKGYGGNVSVVYDAVGMGAFVQSYLNLSSDDAAVWEGYQANAAIRNPNRVYVAGKQNKDFFQNVKAQDWWRMADRMRNTATALKYKKLGRPIPFAIEDMFFINPKINDLQKLKTEMTTLKIKKSKDNSKFMVQSKEDLKKEKIRSPNYADAAIMAINPVDYYSYGDSVEEAIKNGTFGI